LIMNEQDRRTFFKALLTIPASLLFGDICAGESEPKTDISEIRIHPGACDMKWQRTILCLSEHSLLKSEIEKCAQDISCHLWHAEPDSADIYAVPRFVEIFNRNIINLSEWNDYVAFCNQTFDDVPCIIIDDIQDISLPKTKAILRFDISNDDSVAGIIATIRDIRKQIDRNLPEQCKFRRLEGPYLIR